MTNLYMIARTENGIRVYSGEEEINSYLNYYQKEWGPAKFGLDLEEGEHLIIKGDIVNPKPKQIVKEWEF